MKLWIDSDFLNTSAALTSPHQPQPSHMAENSLLLGTRHYSVQLTNQTDTLVLTNQTDTLVLHLSVHRELYPYKTPGTSFVFFPTVQGPSMVCVTLYPVYAIDAI